MSVCMARAALLGAVLVLCGCGGGGGGIPAGSANDGGIQLGGTGHTTPGPGTGNADTGNPGTAGPDTGKPGAGDSGTGSDGTGNSGTDNPGAGNPGSGDPGTGHPDTGSSCNGTISGCFNVNLVQMGKYKDNKKAAASYSFDDGDISSFRIADIFEGLGLRATFYIIAGIIPDQDWAKWKGLMQKGHEIGNHSMTHEVDMELPNVSDATLDTEINGAKRILSARLGMPVLTFAFPWHHYTDHAFRMAMQGHVDVRRLEREGDPTYSFAFLDMEPDHHPDPAKALDDVNNQLQATVNNGGWFVAGGHGIDGDGWSPVTSDFLRNHLAFAKKIPGLWIDTYLNVYRYRTCRSLATPELSVLSSRKATLRLTGNFDAALCTEPLTVTIPSTDPSFPASRVRVHDAAGDDIPFKYMGDKLLINLRPGDKAVIEIAS